MASALLKKLCEKIAVDYCRLSIVSNRDGLLAREDVRRLLREQCGLNVVYGSNIALRVHYELTYKHDESGRYVYVTAHPESIVPDMASEAYRTDFAVGELLPLFQDKSLLEGLSWEALEAISRRCSIRHIPMAECRQMVDDVKRELEEKRQQSAAHFQEQMEKIAVDWTHLTADAIQALSNCMTDAIRYGVYDAIAPQVAELNETFQQWLDAGYFATLNSSHLYHPKSVNKILPFLAEKYGYNGRVALVVVDGLAYWQYAVLHRYLQDKGVKAEQGYTLAWIPTITMLSRQAIFRGDTPRQDYRQNPDNEKVLWREFWNAHGFSGMEVQYLSDRDEFAINEGVRRLTYVTVEMDEKMHSSSHYRDLLSLTENWCPRIAEKIDTMKSMGFTVYLTTDHGSTLAQGWQPISQAEKVFLYKDGSRGKRHLIYNNAHEQQAFVAAHGQEISLLCHDNNWLAVRTDQCFERQGQQLITHGGSHFWEVVIPFVKI